VFHLLFPPPLYVLLVPPVVLDQAEVRIQRNQVDAIHRDELQDPGEERGQVWRGHRRNCGTVAERIQDLVHSKGNDFRQEH
jgi:hypothetical protein